MNRRPSYASVAGGSASGSGTTQTAPARSGAFADLMNSAPTSTSYNYGEEAGYRESESHGQGMNHDGSHTISWPAVANAWSKSNTSTNYWDQSLPAIHEAPGAGQERLIRPSYLRRSRYMEKLDVAKRAKLVSERDVGSAAPPSTKTGTLSASSSAVNLHRMAPSHRGMTYEIVEHSPVPDDDVVPPLPSHWKEYDKSGGFEISQDGYDIRCSSAMKVQEHEAAAARTDSPMPPQCGIYYYEVSILSKGKDGMVAIGFSGPKAELNKLPGWEPDSWAYHGDDGKSFCCQIAGKPYGATFTAGDVVGCCVNFRTSTAFFTKNGVSQGVVFKDIKPIPLYPCVGMKRPGPHVKVNFGQAPFMFDIDGYVLRETSNVREEIHKADVSSLHPPLDESTLIKELVAQFLRHDGYVETSKAFTEEMRTEAKALDKSLEGVASDFELQQDIDANNRQHIRSAILEGDIDKALKRTHAFYPHVLNDNPNIYFHLRCRKFVEMIRLCTEPHRASPREKSTNGHLNQEVFGQDMELDEPVQVGDDWDHMDTEDSAVDPEKRLNETLRYGKELQQEYNDDSSKEQALRNIFALFAYEDPAQSPAAPVMDPSGREPVAEELNSAILVSLGKSSSAAIERVYQQADVLVAEITEQGGPGAFVHLDADSR